MTPGRPVVPAQADRRGRGEIVVATDGSAAAATAVRYALGLASDRGLPVRIVHVAPTHVPVPVALGPAVEAAGQDLLADVARRARLAAPGVDVRTSLLRGPRGPRLVAVARDAALVVLGQSARPRHLVTGSTAAALIAHTDRPVRVVPPDWFRLTGRCEVVVGVEDPATAHDLVERGFEIAEELGEPLVLLHAWGLPSGYEEVMAAAEGDHAWSAALSARVAEAVATVRHRHPTVPYEIRIVHARAARALEAASRRASFLVVGRPARRGRPGLGRDLAQAVVTVSGCPVEIGPACGAPGPLAEEWDLELEAEGRMLR